MTLKELLKASLRKIGVLATGETPDASEINDAKTALNALLGSWSNEGLMVPNTVRETFTLTNGKSSYTMGVAGDFDTTRPLEIIKMGLVLDNSQTEFELPVNVITEEKWAMITIKGTESNIPRKVWPENTYPLETLNVWPVPSEANKLSIYSRKPLTKYTDLSTELELPEGYERALIYNLAIEMAPEFGVKTPQEVVVIATSSKEVIKRTNKKVMYLYCDSAVTSNNRTYNYLTGDYD